MRTKTLSLLTICAAIILPVAASAKTPSFGDSLRSEGLMWDHDVASLYGKARAPESIDRLPARESGAVGIAGGADGMFHAYAVVGQAEHELSGTIQYSDGAVGSVLDIQRDLGIRKTTTERFGAQFRIGMLRINGSYQKYDMSGQGNTNFTFGGVNFTGTTDTKLDVTNYTGDIGLAFGLGPIELGFGLGVHVYDMNFRITGTEQITNLTRTEENDLFGPVPVLSVYAGFSLFDIAIQPTLQVMKSPKLDGVEGMTYDLSVMLKYYIVNNIAIGVEGGYTFLEIEKQDSGNNDSTNGDIELDSMRLSLVLGVSF